MTQRRMMEELSWDEFCRLPLDARAPYFKQSSGRPYHCVIAQQFDRESLDALCDLATRIRRIAKSKVGMEFLSTLMRNKRAMLYFTQPSTRTFLSFFSACQILGFSPADCGRISAPLCILSKNVCAALRRKHFVFGALRQTQAALPPLLR